MKLDDINAAVASFREQGMAKVHATINSAPFWRQDEYAAEGVRALDVRAEHYRASLGVPDDQPEVTQSIAQDEPASAVVTPGVKG